MYEIAAALVALYLPEGGPASALPRRRWPAVVAALRRYPALSPSEALIQAHLEQEAVFLNESRLDRAHELLLSGCALTAECGGYPLRWLEVLGAGAPPVIWKRGQLPIGKGCMSIVGSREVSPAVYRFCRSCGVRAAQARWIVITGGAEGCDRAAIAGAGAQSVVLLPCGLGARRTQAGCELSLSPWQSGFSAAAAMQRNALIYAASAFSIVGAVRFKEGGTWHGAIGCLRSKSSPIFVYKDQPDGGIGARSLAALGARWIGSASEIPSLLEAPPSPKDLFSEAG